MTSSPAASGPAFLIVALLWLVAFGGAAIASEIDAYRLGTGDKVRVTVYNEKDLSGDFEVSDQGTISLPLIGQVAVRGNTLAEVDRIVRDKLGADFLVNPRVNVEVLNYRPFYIVGEVRNPGSYAYVNDMKVLNAVALAGGFTPRARKDRVFIKRAGQPQAGEQPAAEDDSVLPGDIVRVAERFF